MLTIALTMQKGSKRLRRRLASFPTNPPHAQITPATIAESDLSHPRQSGPAIQPCKLGRSFGFHSLAQLAGTPATEPSTDPK